MDLLEPRAAELTAAMHDVGYLVNNTSAYTVRFLPPLVIEDEDLAGVLAALRSALAA